MNIQDLYFIQTTDYAPEQYDVILDDGTKVGYIRERYSVIECYPYSLKNQDILWNHILLKQNGTLVDDVLIDCGRQICNYHNELAFLKTVLS